MPLTLPSSGSAFDVRQFANPDRQDPDLPKRHIRVAREWGVATLAGRVSLPFLICLFTAR